MVDLKSYTPMIDAILSAADPDQATPKKIRKALQELFGVDLDSRRKEVNKIIVERFQESQDHPKKLVSVDELSKQDEINVKQLVKGSTRKRAKSGSKDSSTKKKRSSESTGGFNKTKVLIAEPLSELLGETESTRTQVVKSVWDYIKRNDLQNPNDRREILCDDRMKPIFGEKVTMFSMNKALAKYIRNAPSSPATTAVKEETQDNNTQGSAASNNRDKEDNDEDDNADNADNDEDEVEGENQDERESSNHEQEEESSGDSEDSQDEEEA